MILKSFQVQIVSEELIVNLKSKWPSLDVAVSESSEEQSSAMPVPSTSKGKNLPNIQCPRCTFETNRQSYLDQHIKGRINVYERPI